MRPGFGWIIAGVVLLGGGIALTVTGPRRVYYGAIIVGALWIGRGVYRLTRPA